MPNCRAARDEESQIANFGEKTPEVHPPASPPPRLTPLQVGLKEYYIKYNIKYTNSCYVFSFLHNFKLKTYYCLKIAD